MCTKYLLALLSLSLISVTTSSESSCLSSAAELQAAIDQLPRGQPYGGIPELLLCANADVIPVSQPIRVHQRSVRIACASTSTTSSSGRKCTLKGVESAESRLLEVIGTENAFDTYTVQLSQLHLDSGASYLNTGINTDNGSTLQAVGGGAVSAVGANLIVEDCHFENNVASQRGGAVQVHDLGRPILFVISNTSFENNLSIEDDCSSVFFQQQHPMTMAELNRERDFIPSASSRRASSVLDQWDDPAMAAEALQQYKPKPGATLCF